MNNFFANLYELALRHPQFSTMVWKQQDYIWLGVFLIGISVFFTIVFYKFLDPSPTKWYKWVIILMIPSALAVFGLSMYWLLTGSLEIPLINQVQGVWEFGLTLSLWNAIYALILTLILSIVFKRFSINNVNNPF